MSQLVRLFVVLCLSMICGCADYAALMPLPSAGLTEVRSAPPGIDYHWVVGHYRWEMGQKEYVWVRGRWSKVIPEHRWLKGQYHVVHREDFRVKQWTPGRWVPRRRSAAPELGRPSQDRDSTRPERSGVEGK